jgi:DtxR family manganese transport transcriptional regulator
MDAIERRRAAFERAREAHRHATAEDYVELVDDLLAAHGEARLVDLAAALGVSTATARKVLDRLQRAGLIEQRPYRSLFLTGEGKALAERSRRRHGIVESFLRALGVSPGIAELDAEGIEHHVSEETVDAMAAFTERVKKAAE